MIETALGFNGGVTAPHRMAAMAGRDVLARGGTAVEAMVAAAAMIAVCYPHMNGIGGDGFWLIRRPGAAPVAISACGRAAALAAPSFWEGAAAIPARGGAAALTVPGTIDGWRLALEQGPVSGIPLAELVQAAVDAARSGVPVTRNQSDCTADKLAGLRDVPGFADLFLSGGEVPAPGAPLVQAALADTLEKIGRDGPRAFYEGEIAEAHAAYLEAHGSPLRLADFTGFRAETHAALTVETKEGRIWNMTPPTQGVASLAILGVFDRLDAPEGESFAHIHGLIEATKQAFIRRNAELADPDVMTTPAQEWLTQEALSAMAARVDMDRAAPWPHVQKPGDTIWMGAADKDGCVVSFIQSVYWEFGSGLACPQTGVFFQNRGAGFSLDPAHPNVVAPGKRPFHTLNPAMAELRDGTVLAYGTMGGEGQPQTQAAIFTRIAKYGVPMQQAITAPRWLLGKTWGDATETLKLENRFPPALIEALRAAGHNVEIIPPFSDLCGHAGAISISPAGLIAGASDPRSDGAAAVF